MERFLSFAREAGNPGLGCWTINEIRVVTYKHRYGLLGLNSYPQQKDEIVNSYQNRGWVLNAWFYDNYLGTSRLADYLGDELITERWQEALFEFYLR